MTARKRQEGASARARGGDGDGGRGRDGGTVLRGRTERTFLPPSFHSLQPFFATAFHPPTPPPPFPPLLFFPSAHRLFPIEFSFLAFPFLFQSLFLFFLVVANKLFESLRSINRKERERREEKGKEKRNKICFNDAQFFFQLKKRKLFQINRAIRKEKSIERGGWSWSRHAGFGFFFSFLSLPPLIERRG